VGGDPTAPFEVGVEWLTGEGPRHHEFREGDPFTELLQQHDHLDSVRAAITRRIEEGNFYPGRDDYDLSGISGVPKYIKDYSTIVTAGQTGNLAVTYLGSYRLDFYIVDVDFQAGTATVLFYVGNSSTLASGTRPPVIGYTDFWLRYIEPAINSATASGPTSRTTQDFWWIEVISLK